MVAAEDSAGDYEEPPRSIDSIKYNNIVFHTIPKTEVVPAFEMNSDIMHNLKPFEQIYKITVYERSASAHALDKFKEDESAIQAVEDLNNQITLINNTLNDDEEPFRSRMFVEFSNRSKISIPIGSSRAG